jgi:hypothetical protein
MRKLDKYLVKIEICKESRWRKLLSRQGLGGPNQPSWALIVKVKKCKRYSMKLDEDMSDNGGDHGLVTMTNEMKHWRTDVKLLMEYEMTNDMNIYVLWICTSASYVSGYV